MADDISVLINDVSDIAVAVNAIVITRAKIQGHKPNLFLHYVSKGINHMAEIGDFSKYTQMDEEELAEFIYMMHGLILKHSDLTEEAQRAIIIQALDDNNEKAFEK